jgi:hypothetical protein
VLSLESKNPGGMLAIARVPELHSRYALFRGGCRLSGSTSRAHRECNCVGGEHIARTLVLVLVLAGAERGWPCRAYDIMRHARST